MVGTRLWGANLRRATAIDAQMTNTNIMRATFVGADLSNASLKGAFGSATFKKATFLNTTCPNKKKVTSPKSC